MRNFHIVFIAKKTQIRMLKSQSNNICLSTSDPFFTPKKSLFSKYCIFYMRNGELIITQFIVKKAFCNFILTTLCLGEEVWAFHAHVVRQIAIMFGKDAVQA
jgi:hypothetical protein